MADELISILSLKVYPAGIPICARWNFDQWGKAAGRTLQETSAGMKRIAENTTGEYALIAVVDGTAAGMALLIECDLESYRHLKPWIAGVYTQPHLRRRGIATALLHALEDLARRDGNDTVYLYTRLQAFYARLGWSVVELLGGENRDLCIMSKQLNQTS